MCPTQLREAGVLYTVEGCVLYAAERGVSYAAEGGVSNAAERDARAYTVRGEKCLLRS